jgi:predicted dehydrogenase
MVSSGFAMDLCLQRPDLHTKHIVQAVGSSSIEKAKKFVADRCPSQNPNLYDTYQGVFDDPDVEAVYIGTPHPLHLENALGAIAAGKHVLCEKPFAMNAREAQIMIDAANKKGVFIMEAVWTLFKPVTRKLASLLHEDKIIGDLTTVFADFSVRDPVSERLPNPGRLDKWQGVGILLDATIYCLNWASLALDYSPDRQAGVEPQQTSSMIFHETGSEKKIDEKAVLVLSYPDLKAQAVCSGSFLNHGSKEFATFWGTKGSITVSGQTASMPDALIIRVNGQKEKRLDFNHTGWGFQFEADAVAEDLRAGRQQNSICSWDHTLRIMKRMDAARAQCGLKYSQDQE